MKRRTAAATASVAGLVLAGSLIAASPGYADTTTPNTPAVAVAATPSAGAPKTDGAAALCRRVPRLERRVKRDIRRLEAGAGTRGSVTRLQDRVKLAESEGHTAIADYLRDRLAARTSLLSRLRTAQSDLPSVASWCASQGTAAGGGSAAS